MVLLTLYKKYGFVISAFVPALTIATSTSGQFVNGVTVVDGGIFGEPCPQLPISPRSGFGSPVPEFVVIIVNPPVKPVLAFPFTIPKEPSVNNTVNLPVLSINVPEVSAVCVLTVALQTRR